CTRRSRRIREGAVVASAVRIALVVFDMAGTTVRDDDAVNVCLREALRASGIDVTRDEVNGVMGIAKPVAIRALVESRSPGVVVGRARVAEIHDDFLRRMSQHYRFSDSVEPMPHTLEVFETLKRADVSVALDTGFNRTIVNAILDRLGWYPSALIDATVAS